MRYTIKEDEIILKTIQECPSNLTAAFQEASEKLAEVGFFRSLDSVSQRWYNCLKKQCTENNVVVLASASSLGMIPNTKNAIREYDKDGNAINNSIKMFTRSMPKDKLVELFLQNKSKSEKKAILTRIIQTY